MVQCREYLRARGAKQVLDLGSGFGRWSNFVSRDSGCRATGLDYTIGGALLGSELGRGTANSAFVTGEITRLPFAESSFDGLIAVLILDNVAKPDGQDAVREVGRVLRPGSPGFVVLNPWPMPAGTDAETNPTSSCTRHDYADREVLDDLLQGWRVVGWERGEHDLRCYQVLI